MTTCASGRSFAGMKRSLVLTSLVALAVALTIPSAAPAAKNGTLRLSASGAPGLTGAAKRSVTLRAINVATGAVIESRSPKKLATALKLAPGPYLIALRATDLPGRAREALSKLVRVRAGRSTSLKLRLKPLRARPKPAKRIYVAAGADDFYAPAEQSAGKLVIGIDPNLVADGVKGYDQGLPLDSMIATPLSEGCKAGQQELLLVELRRRAEILEELQHANDPRFDQTSTVKPGNLLRERQIVRGSAKLAGGRFAIHLELVDLASGRVLAVSDAKGAKRQIFDLVDRAGEKLRSEACKPKQSTKVDVKFTGTGNYTRDEGTAATDSEDHIRADFSWSIEYRSVVLDETAGSLNFAAASIVTGNWRTDGRYGAAGPGNYSCSADVVGYSGTFASANVERSGSRVKLSVHPFLMIQGDPINTSCSGLPGPPYASFAAFGNRPANIGVAEFDLAEINGVSSSFNVGPQVGLAADCSDMLSDHETPCSQSQSWSGTISVVRSAE